ncbi:hypothetical protein SAMD00023353_0104190 [Rosellinia necatrix]|uniref:Uncharacterized protein n=1 Tax=Rosellinia necatrix TaxID=77044 RepID=A0A1S8A4V7_ROSNE|nr:hypothetical protein SAMD00023353_0104190 [Rosellinia necatrix]
MQIPVSVIIIATATMLSRINASPVPNSDVIDAAANAIGGVHDPGTQARIFQSAAAEEPDA